jgi:predicted alpha/beta-hydrolase family hydrolase
MPACRVLAAHHNTGGKHSGVNREPLPVWFPAFQSIGAIFPNRREVSDSRIQPVEDAPAGIVPVRGYLHAPARASGDGIVLTHGAGTNCNAPLLVALANAFCDAGVTVLRCDLPFRQVRRHGPPRGDAERDQQGLRRAIEWLCEKAGGRIFLGGHSYGGRQASILAASEPGLAHALLLLSYPLHPPKKPAQLRTAHFAELRTPALFVHGARDGFGTLGEVTAALRLIPARTQLLPIDSAGHELMTARNRASLPLAIASAFASFAVPA